MTADDAPRIIACWEIVLEHRQGVHGGVAQRVAMLPTDLADIIDCLKVCHTTIVELRAEVQRLTTLARPNA
jgi:hypothetical protein